jgi:predicted porin
MVTATMPIRPGLTGLFGYSKDNSKVSTADSKWAVGANYALSKRTTLGADVFQQERATGSTGFVLRARHTF